MKSIRVQKNITKALAVLLGSFFLTSGVAYASHPGESAAIISCGELQSFLGSVQIFDASRTQVIDVVPKRKLQCGDWISVSEGKAVIEHLQGFKITLGAGSFMQILDPHSGENPEQDDFALYRGQAMIENSSDTKTLKVATANARAGFKKSQAYLVYSIDQQVTQLVGIEGKSSLENRFLDSRPSWVSSAQMVNMGDLEGRPVPSQPRAVSMTELRERLAKLGVQQEIQNQMMEISRTLAVIRMPTSLEPKAPRHTTMSSYELSQKTEPKNEAPKVAPVESVVPQRKKAPARKIASLSASSHEERESGPSKEEIERQRLLKKISEIEIE